MKLYCSEERQLLVDTMGSNIINIEDAPVVSKQYLYYYKYEMNKEFIKGLSLIRVM